ncbi:cysteine hydrolase [Baekduia soli]|uniref:Cysteine hydrolase n=1 Tax=Baekduia soli TaxID=496014 RepID=A0A5B8U5A6_9ACTN|nr:isochorismatase family cysteine hydrolase [Baekduia soli]QEC48028.1 cysteine hydrolase [Baekduia soli]
MVNPTTVPAALVLLDFQQGLTAIPDAADPPPLAAAVAEHGVLDKAAAALATARARGLTVAHVRVAFEAGHANRTNRTPRFDDHEAAGRFLLGSAASEFCTEVAPADGEPVFSKGSVAAFASTTLERALRVRGARTLFLAGIATHLAVESAAREAADRGFEVVVLGDGCTAPDQGLHEHAITQTIPLFAEVIDTDGLGQRLDAVTG